MIKSMNNISHQRNFVHSKFIIVAMMTEQCNDDDDDRRWLLSCGDNHDEIMMMWWSNWWTIVKYFTPTQFRTFEIYTGRADDENNDEDRR